MYHKTIRASEIIAKSVMTVYDKQDGGFCTRLGATERCLQVDDKMATSASVKMKNVATFAGVVEL